MGQPAAGPVVAIDLGGTQIRTAYVTTAFEVSFRRAAPTGDSSRIDAVIADISRLAREAAADVSTAGLPPPVGIGISSPGPIDPWRGLVVAPPNLHGWHDVPLADEVERALGLPTFLERDTNVAVLAEWQAGAAAAADDVVYVTVSTGIGGGVVSGGQPLMGPDATAGEVGHMTVEIDGPLCGDGKPGHAEAIGSGTAIARDGRTAVEEARAPMLARLVGGDATTVSAALVARAADEGDLACAAIMDRAYQAVGAMCASLVNVLNPEVIVLGGSIAEHRPRLREVVREEIDRRSFAIPAARVRVVAPHFGDDVSLVGCVPLVAARLHDPAFRRDGAAAPPIHGQT
ncbi:MAG: ROK family protein [Chloroflexota bacterium]|nr:ROK family protein [Chloroflexota bacterium]